MATEEKQITELKDKIKVLENLPGEGEADLVKSYKKELAKLEGNKEEGTKVTEENVGNFEIPMTQDEYEAAGSKFANEGTHVSEMGLPSWDTPGRSIAFPFTIVEGVDAGKENKISAGVGPTAVWKLKEVLAAVGVAVKIVNGKPNFNGAECVGKKFLSVWTKEMDTRSAEEGGKGGTYTKPTSALPITAKAEKLDG